MGKTPVQPTEQRTKQERKPNLWLADDELKITHTNEPRIHRVVFNAKETNGLIPRKSSVFIKLRSKIPNWSDNVGFNYWKNNSYTLGLTHLGKIVIYVKSDLSVFPKEFLRSLRQDFELDDIEIQFLIQRLDFVELEIAHKINDPDGKIKGAKVEYRFNDLVKKLIAFTDESNGSLELELKGDPEIASNLEFLLRDKLSAILYFVELTKIVIKLTEISKELNNEIDFVKNGVIFLIDHLLNKKLNNKGDQQSL